MLLGGLAREGAPCHTFACGLQSLPLSACWLPLGAQLAGLPGFVEGSSRICDGTHHDDGVEQSLQSTPVGIT